MAVVGKDVTAEEGMRVVITEEGRAWDINKAKRGDSSQGGSGSIIELREGGQVSCWCCMDCKCGRCLRFQRTGSQLEHVE